MTTPVNIGLPAAIVAQIPESAVLRVGTVTSFDSGYISVAVSGSTTLVRASYLIGGYAPAVGDQVILSKQGSQWIVLGEISANPGTNAVANHSFETLNPAGTYAANWTEYIPAGQSVDMDTGVGTVLGNMFDGQRVGFVHAGFINDASSTATGTAYILSDPFPVNPGELWALSGWVTVSDGADFLFAEIGADINLAVYADAMSTFPSGTILAQTSTFDPSLIAPAVWVKITNSFPGAWNGFPIPEGGNFAQVICKGTCTRTTGVFTGFGESTIDIFFDRIQAIKIR